MSTADLSISSRIKQLNVSTMSRDGKCVLYVMSRDQRVRDNHALLAAQKHALALSLPLAVVFCLVSRSGHRARSHYDWVLVGLKEVERDLVKLNIPFLMLLGDVTKRLEGVITHTTPCVVYFDFNPLSGQTSLRKHIATFADCSVFTVDNHNVVPVWAASDKQEVGARTLRPRIHRLLSDYLVEPEQATPHPYSWPGRIMTIKELRPKIEIFLAELIDNGQSNLTKLYPSGSKNAHIYLNDFIENRLKGYADKRNDPSIDGLSGLSPYLHFGQISSLRVALEVKLASHIDPSLLTSAEVLIEEMIVRKELSDNFCYYNPNYNNLAGAPQWAQSTLAKHANDPRELIYSLEEFEHAKTHDPAWNAAQIQMVKTGKMHGYMRMYWAKKVLEWSPSPEEAIKTLIYLNDFYSIDGGDPNGYVGILWSVAGLHDRPWGERPIYGTVRSMVYSGLKRKFDIQVYIDKY